MSSHGRRAVMPASLIIAGLVGLFVSWRIQMFGLFNAGLPLGTVIAVAGALLSAYLIGLALYILLSGKAFLDLPDAVLIGAYIALVLLLFEGGAYIALVLTQIAFNSLNN